MFGLEIPGLVTLAILASAEPQICGNPARPVVEVTTSESTIDFDTTKSKEELSQFSIATVSPWPETYHTEVGGVMHGEISIDHRISFKKKIDPATGQGCVWFDKVEVNINMKPTIYIANDFFDDTCFFREVFTHESTHVDIDRSIIRKYAGQIGDGLNMVFMEPDDFVSGKVPEYYIESVRLQMGRTVEAAIGVMFNKMLRDRAERQQNADSLNEYEQIMRTCNKSS